MIKCAETEFVPPTTGVIVKAAALSAGFHTVRVDVATVVELSGGISPKKSA